MIGVFSYTVAKEADNKAFLNTCALIEANFKEITKEEPLIDVDGSVYQTYHTPKGTIKVSNDYYVDATYVDSELNLAPIIKSVV